MGFAAILSASRASADSSGGLRACLHFAGQTLVEYQARQAVRAGADRIFIMVSVITPALSQAVDRLSADGIAVALVRDMVSMVRDAPRDVDALLMADGAIVSQAHVDSLGAAEGDTLLVADDSRASAPLERIDAGQRWAGLARISPALLFGTLDMIGDWDLALTLVRAMIAASRADGHIDEAERRHIMDKLSVSGLSADAAAFLESELANPVDIDAIVGAAKTEEERVEIYTASRLTIEPETRAERGYLDLLAGRLGLPDALVDHIEATVSAAKVPATA